MLVEVCSYHFLCALEVRVPVVALSLLESRSRALNREKRKIKKAMIAIKGEERDALIQGEKMV